jgi:hypothetical protein
MQSFFGQATYKYISSQEICFFVSSGKVVPGLPRSPEKEPGSVEFVVLLLHRGEGTANVISVSGRSNDRHQTHLNLANESHFSLSCDSCENGHFASC